MNISPPKPNSVVWPEVNIFIPYSEFYPATPISLIGFNYQPVKTEGDFGYSHFFSDRWKEGKTFINIEQDTVVWPGAVKAIWECPREWCVYACQLPVHQSIDLENEKNGVPLACMKVSSEMIKKSPNLWDKHIMWNVCDRHIMKSGAKVHQHYPGVVNANKVFLDFLGGVEL